MRVRAVCRATRLTIGVGDPPGAALHRADLCVQELISLHHVPHLQRRRGVTHSLHHPLDHHAVGGRVRTRGEVLRLRARRSCDRNVRLPHRRVDGNLSGRRGQRSRARVLECAVGGERGVGAHDAALGGRYERVRGRARDALQLGVRAVPRGARARQVARAERRVRHTDLASCARVVRAQGLAGVRVEATDLLLLVAETGARVARCRVQLTVRLVDARPEVGSRVRREVAHGGALGGVAPRVSTHRCGEKNNEGSDGEDRERAHVER